MRFRKNYKADRKQVTERYYLDEEILQRLGKGH